MISFQLIEETAGEVEQTRRLASTGAITTPQSVAEVINLINSEAEVPPNMTFPCRPFSHGTRLVTVELQFRDASEAEPVATAEASKPSCAGVMRVTVGATATRRYGGESVVSLVERLGAGAGTTGTGTGGATTGTGAGTTATPGMTGGASTMTGVGAGTTGTGGPGTGTVATRLIPSGVAAIGVKASACSPPGTSACSGPPENWTAPNGAYVSQTITEPQAVAEMIATIESLPLVTDTNDYACPAKPVGEPYIELQFRESLQTEARVRALGSVRGCDILYLVGSNDGRRDVRPVIALAEKLLGVTL